jgi:hypothetical protein
MVTAHSAIPFRLLCGFSSAAAGEFFCFDIPVLSRFYLDHWNTSSAALTVVLQDHLEVIQQAMRGAPKLFADCSRTTGNPSIADK